MPIRQTQKRCRTCGRLTLHQKETFSAALGCLGTLLTAGLFLPFWLLADLAGIIRPWRCQACGRAYHMSVGGLLVSLVVLGLWALVIYFVVQGL